jgi:hypothetical protein
MATRFHPWKYSFHSPLPYLCSGWQKHQTNNIVVGIMCGVHILRVNHLKWEPRGFWVIQGCVLKKNSMWCHCFMRELAGVGGVAVLDGAVCTEQSPLRHGSNKLYWQPAKAHGGQFVWKCTLWHSWLSSIHHLHSPKTQGLGPRLTDWLPFSSWSWSW